MKENVYDYIQGHKIQTGIFILGLIVGSVGEVYSLKNSCFPYHIIDTEMDTYELGISCIADPFGPLNNNVGYNPDQGLYTTSQLFTRIQNPDLPYFEERSWMANK